MTSQFTSRLGLMKPQNADTFLRQDFLDTMAILDGSPGIFICTSTTRPTDWGAAQAGRMIFESDLARVIRWTGTDWSLLNQFARVTQHSTASLSITLGQNASPPAYSLGSFTPGRFGKAIVWGYAAFSQQEATAQAVTCSLRLNGSEIGFGPADVGRSGTNASNNDRILVPVMGSANITDITHQLSMKVDVGSTSSASVVFHGVKAFVLLAEQ